jgi:hypothetical protein
METCKRGSCSAEKNPSEKKIATLAILFHCWSAPEEEGKTNRTYIIEPLCFVNVTDGRAIFYVARRWGKPPGTALILVSSLTTAAAWLLCWIDHSSCSALVVDL